MILIPIIFFVIALAGITGMLLYQVRVVRAREVDIQSTNFVFFIYPDFRQLKREAVRQSKKLGHRMVIVVLKGWVIVTYFVGKKVKEQKTKFYTRLNLKQKKEEPVNKEVSTFLQTISEYKERMKRFKQKIQEADRQ